MNAQFDDAEGFSEGLAAVKVGNHWGYINDKGKMTINPEFSVPTPASEFARGITKITPGLYINRSKLPVWPIVRSFDADFAELEPALDAPRVSGQRLDKAEWSTGNAPGVVRPIFFNTHGGDPTSFGQAVFGDRKSAALAAKLEFDSLFFVRDNGSVWFAMKPTPKGWIPIPDIPPAPFMVGEPSAPSNLADRPVEQEPERASMGSNGHVQIHSVK